MSSFVVSRGYDFRPSLISNFDGNRSVREFESNSARNSNDISYTTTEDMETYKETTESSYDRDADTNSLTST